MADHRKPVAGSSREDAARGGAAHHAVQSRQAGTTAARTSGGKAMTGWKSARSVLCVRLDAIGDVLMTTPALQALKHSLPQCRLTLLTSTSGAEAGRLAPAIEEVIVYEAPWMKSAAH